MEPRCPSFCAASRIQKDCLASPFRTSSVAFVLDEVQSLVKRGGGTIRENPANSLRWHLPQEKQMQTAANVRPFGKRRVLLATAMAANFSPAMVPIFWQEAVCRAVSTLFLEAVFAGFCFPMRTLPHLFTAVVRAGVTRSLAGRWSPFC